MAHPPRERSDRRRYPNRRSGLDRRQTDVPVEVDRRRKGERRKADRRAWKERRAGGGGRGEG